MKKFTVDEIYHRVFKDCPGSLFAPWHGSTEAYEPGSVIDTIEVIDENGEEGTLTIVCPNIPSGVVEVGGAYEPLATLLRYPDNTYHFALTYDPDATSGPYADSYYEGTGVRDMAIVPVKTQDPWAEEIEKILTENSIWWYSGNVFPLKYEQEIFKKLNSGEFADIGSLTLGHRDSCGSSESHSHCEAKPTHFVLHPDIIVPTNDGKD